MAVIWRIIIGFIFAIILHELTHLAVIAYYKIPLKALVFTKFGGFGFLIDDETHISDNKKLIFLHFLPLIWCLMIFVDPTDPFFQMFPFASEPHNQKRLF